MADDMNKQGGQFGRGQSGQNQPGQQQNKNKKGGQFNEEDDQNRDRERRAS